MENDILTCESCRFTALKCDEYPCTHCVHNYGTENHYLKAFDNEKWVERIVEYSNGTITPEMIKTQSCADLMNMVKRITPKRKDAVTHPDHYVDGRQYEPKDVIRDWGLNFNLGTAVKYISRAGRKDDIVQDLSKAIEYIEFEIGAIKKEREKNGTD